MTFQPVIRARKTSRTLLSLAALGIGLFPAAAPAQTASPFQLRVAEGNSVFLVPNGATLNFAAKSVGQTFSATITAIYQGATSVTINNQPSILGSTAFTVSPLAAVPLKLNPGDAITLTLNFSPTSSSTAAAQFNLGYVEASASAGSTGTAGFIQFSLAGTVPDLSVSYFLQSNGNVLPLPAESSLVFQPTLVNTSSSATVIISNRGSGVGLVNSIVVTGDAFQPLGLPLPPFGVAANSDVRFVINYLPKQVGTDTGSLKIDLGGTLFSANLTGNGINFSFSYQTVAAGGNTTFLPNQPLALPDTALGDTSSVTVRVQNTGSAPGTVSTIGTTSGAFSLSDLPLTPVILNPNDILTFTLNFTPIQSGKATGTLRVGNDLFSLTGNGLGPKLLFSYGGGSGSTILSGGVVIFSPLQVGQTSQLPFTVRNGGTTVAQVASVGVADTHGIFTLSGLPTLPASLNPGDTFTFTINFAPATTGFSTTQLVIDTAGFVVSGSGTQPPALPAVQFTGTSGNVDPLSQPAVGLKLAASYPIDLTGTLTLNLSSASFAPDPSVQFSTGGQTVAFTIPANTTDAIFARSGNQIRLQSGTTAGTITLTPAFATVSGLDLTPAPAPTTSLTIASSAPRLLTVTLTSASATGMVLRVSGFSTTRSLSKLTFQFTPTSDVSAAGAAVSVDVSAAAATWYTSTQSQSFGGQFAVSVPFSLQSSSTTVTSPVSKIQSVSVTATNGQGTSSALSTPITP